MPEEDRALLARCLEWEIEREEQIAERVDRHDWGRAFLSPTIPLVWDANWVLVERTGMTAAEIVEAGEEALGPLGMQHRTIALGNAEDGRRLAPDFESRGWDVEPGVYMVWRGAPDRESEIGVAQRSLNQIEDLRRSLIRHNLSTTEVPYEGAAEQLLEWDRRVGVCDGDRWFVAPAGDAPASACRLLARTGIGQVEDVGTLPEARRQGFARAVTLAAARSSGQDGNQLTFLGALANDWPRRFYARLGFDEIGCLYSFRLKPPAPT